MRQRSCFLLKSWEFPNYKQPFLFLSHIFEFFSEQVVNKTCAPKTKPVSKVAQYLRLLTKNDNTDKTLLQLSSHCYETLIDRPRLLEHQQALEFVHFRQEAVTNWYTNWTSRLRSSSWSDSTQLDILWSGEQCCCRFAATLFRGIAGKFTGYQISSLESKGKNMISSSCFPWLQMLPALIET